jgi:hypothetical protein
MSNKNLVIDLHAREDKNKQIYYVGKLKCPALIDCREGAVFLIYTSVEGEEQLQIALMDNGKDDTNTF